MQPQPQTTIPTPVAFSTSEGYTVVPLHTIAWCEADGSYAKLHLKDGEEIFISKSLKKLENFLPAELFIRVHHHTIVGKWHIRRLLKNEAFEVEMTTGDRLPVAVRRRSKLMKMLTVF